MKTFIIEGIDINRRDKIVSFNPTHEKGVNTSETFNPRYKTVKNINVIAIFDRNNMLDGDGNPLLYALKQMYGWKISTGDIQKLLKQFIKIAEKIKPKYDTIVVIPSKNDLNTNFLHRLNKIIKCDNIVEGIFSKIPAEDVYDNYVDWNKTSQEEEQELINNFTDMFKSTEYFSFKYIKPNLRKYITKSMWVNNNIASKNNELINGKDILVLDDTIASGQTISEFCKNIYKIFKPKSITVITLFSAVK